MNLCIYVCNYPLANEKKRRLPRKKNAEKDLLGYWIGLDFYRYAGEERRVGVLTCAVLPAGLFVHVRMYVTLRWWHELILPSERKRNVA